MWTIERRAELVDMRARTPSVLLGIAGLLCFLWYLVEPWFVTFVDDGPYYSTDFATPTDHLPIYSRIELRRFGRVAYILESRPQRLAAKRRGRFRGMVPDSRKTGRTFRTHQPGEALPDLVCGLESGNQTVFSRGRLPVSQRVCRIPILQS